MTRAGDERRIDRDGIHIDRDVADAVAIEADLDSNVVGAYRFPDPRRRMVAAAIYGVSALLVGVIIDPLVALLPAALGAWHAVGAWRSEITPESALSAAAAEVPFSVGHASAAITFHGLRARPRWSVILYSAADPPDRRALVVVDAVEGNTVGEPYIEDVPPV